MPLVSVVVPVYNGERYLRESLDSILAQTYSPLEVILMDDASTDGTPEIARSYGERIRYVRQSANRGIYGNMNAGIGLARGDYIAIYHSDDVYAPTIVEREVEFMERYPEAGAAFCQDIFIDPQGRERGRLKLPPGIPSGVPLGFEIIFNALLTYKNVFLRCPSCMVRASVHRNIGLYDDARFRNTSDLEMYARISRSYPIGILPGHLFRYRWGHGNSGQRYRYLRTDPERYFPIMDLYLEEGGRRVATPSALAAFEAHRAEDQLMRAVNFYILGRSAEGRSVLSEFRLARLLASAQVQRVRLALLYFGLRAVTALPRLGVMAALFYRNWHSRKPGDPRLPLWRDPLPKLQTGAAR